MPTIAYNLKAIRSFRPKIASPFRTSPGDENKDFSRLLTMIETPVPYRPLPVLVNAFLANIMTFFGLKTANCYI